MSRIWSISPTASAQVAAGRWEEADESIEHALELLPPPQDHARLLTMRAEIALHRGHLDLA